MRTAFINANVITIDPKHPKAEAFLVDGDKFALVGSREGSWPPPETRRLWTWRGRPSFPASTTVTCTC